MKKIINMCIYVIFCLLATTNLQATTKVKLNKTIATIGVGKSIKLQVMKPKKNIKWSSKNEQIAAVSKKGLVKGKKAGETIIISAKFGKKTLNCNVNVIEEQLLQNSEILIAYFSQTGITEKVANQIHNIIGGDIVEIKTEKVYPEYYQTCVDQAKEELENR